MPNNNEPQPEQTIAQEAGLPDNWVPIDSTPIVPSNMAAGTNPYGGGTLPQNFGLQPDSLGAQYKGGGTPFVRLMPVQGAPSTNAQSQSVAEKVVSETINNTTNTSGEFISLQTNGVINAEQDLLNLQNGTNTTAVYVGAGAVQINVPTMGAEYQTVQQAGVAKPQEPVLNFLAPITATDNPGNTSTDIAVPVMVGDFGSGGVKGLVPAPGAGDAAAGDFLKADGTWAIPPGTGGAAHYQTVQQAGSSKPAEPILNFLAPFAATDNPGNTSTDISITIPAPINSFTNQYLASTVGVTANTPTTIDDIVITFPSSGGPWYVRVSYYYNKSGGVNFIGYAEDTTSLAPFATCQGVTNTSISGISASSLAPITYANSATRTFRVRIEDTGNSTIETDSSGSFTSVAKSYMQIEVIPTT